MNLDRRKFLKTSGAALLPAMIPVSSVLAMGTSAAPTGPAVKFFGDGEMFEPVDYLAELQKFQTATGIGRDRYGMGGSIEALERKFTEITGKEKAVFMPSGTMSNQLAISVLSGENTKVIVQETSHVFRDESDAAQTIFNKRLVPLAKDAAYFTGQQLQEGIAALKEAEAFKTSVGAVSIENPVRRADGRVVPLEEIKKISAYCRSNNIGLHLDGARLFLASGWTGVSIKEYASYFDTVYISLYKYFGAAAGAMLCGPREVMDKMAHLVKVHGGAMYGNWANAAMALHRMEGFEARLQNAIQASKAIFAALNKLPGVKISTLDGGTNIYTLDLDKEIDRKKLRDTLRESNILMPIPDGDRAMLMVNETLLYQPVEYIVNTFKKGL
ncbi:aminotransferase class I/II-fold pyridoxal phosphate-dependent enzyme [Fulvivirgaceae bacterium PWU5]|uniref:Aminotransferase class I/II-fold pyridoxal phosphate-dependent enzyme n=1 Tax=Dawidia cretensis TaxID=2782350 RepID=A0AAP2GTK8_9BACT|nr:aminotransferase class I/II-fold pyridoxal phosphate-dependent enzyme [Dawidia cretensis]MBT1708358.1 aminotransferase class I/II-fold pyridoxal phosphate-dependent enzyme [Dawidia cretensis]